LRCLDDLQFKCIFHKQSGSGTGSEINVKAEYGSEFISFFFSGSTTIINADQFCGSAFVLCGSGSWLTVSSKMLSVRDFSDIFS
jgi:hypothetical protein